MSGYNSSTVDGSTTPVPIGSVISPGDKTPYPPQGGPKSVDSQGNTLVPVSYYVYDGNHITFGAQADSAATSDTGTFSFMALFKRALQKLTTLVTNTTGLAQETGGNLATLAGIVSGSKAATKAATGDIVDLSTLLGRVPANLINAGTPTETAVVVGTGSTSVLAANANRKFVLLVNDSPNTIYLSIAGNVAALNTGQRLNANGGSLLLDRYIATSAIKAIATAASSNLLVTEG